MTKKASNWAAAGIGVCWVVWPERRRVDVWRPGDKSPSEELGMADILTGDDVIPFAFPVRDLF